MIEPPAAEAKKPPQLLAIAFIQDARAYVECARLLGRHHQGVTAKYVQPTYFLLCQAIELALKAHLAASGMPKKTLRNKIGHNIDVAFRHARRFGFAPADDRFPELVQWLAPYHFDHSFRYRKGDGFHQLPRASEAAEIIHNTVEVVEPYVRRQYLTTQEKEQRRRRG
jgi:hypothetical protein